MRCCCANMKKKVTALEADAIFTGKTRPLTHQAWLPPRDAKSQDPNLTDLEK